MHNQCDGCAYKQKITSFARDYCCHYLLMTGCRRVEDKDGNCLSKLKVKKGKKKC